MEKYPIIFFFAYCLNKKEMWKGGALIIRYVNQVDKVRNKYVLLKMRQKKDTATDQL